MSPPQPDPPADPASRHPGAAAVRVVVGAVVALVAVLLVPSDWPTVARVLAGWLAFALVVAGWILPLLRLDPVRTRAVATREDDTRIVAPIIVTTAAVVSLIAVGYALQESSRRSGAGALAFAGLGAAAVAASWAVVHLEYTLHYARRFHEQGGGIDFPGTPEPAYLDFAYLSFTLGMTFQVSDTTITTASMRRLVLRHVLLSYVFGVAIIGVVINGLASVVSSG